MAYVFCNHCGHRNPPDSSFCSSCGSALDLQGDRTITLTAVDPLQDAPGADDDVVDPDGRAADRHAVLIVRSGAQAGDRFTLDADLTRLGRHPDSEIILDDITVSRRHADDRSGLPRATSSATPARSTGPTSTRSASSEPCSTTATSCRSASSASSSSSGPMPEPSRSSYLSIGEVLGLLLEEFPDVTISKIRFLESQGLIEPERTPSGYRKFYDDDVELLRMILREQRGELPPAAGDQGSHRAPARSSAGDSTPPRGAAPVVRGRRSSRAGRPSPATRRRVAAGPIKPPEPDTRDRRRPRPASLPGVLRQPGEELCADGVGDPGPARPAGGLRGAAEAQSVGDLYGDDAVEIAAAAGGFLRARCRRPTPARPGARRSSARRGCTSS